MSVTSFFYRMARLSAVTGRRGVRAPTEGSIHKVAR